MMDFRGKYQAEDGGLKTVLHLLNQKYFSFI